MKKIILTIAVTILLGTNICMAGDIRTDSLPYTLNYNPDNKISDETKETYLPFIGEVKYLHFSKCSDSYKKIVQKQVVENDQDVSLLCAVDDFNNDGFSDFSVKLVSDKMCDEHHSCQTYLFVFAGDGNYKKYDGPHIPKDWIAKKVIEEKASKGVLSPLIFKNHQGIGHCIWHWDQGAKQDYVCQIGHRIQENPKWLADKAILENLENEDITEEQDCETRWNILWPWAKKGNKEARYYLFIVAYSNFPGIPKIIFPGRTGDEISSRRDAVIMAIYSLGLHLDKEYEEGYNDNIQDIFEESLSGWVLGDSFIKCLKDNPEQLCIERAASTSPYGDKIIPTFEEYADEIDALVAQGRKPKCLRFRNNGWSKGSGY